MVIEALRDRNGTFELQLMEKHQTRFSGFDDKILSMYALGMTTRDIQGHLHELYGVGSERGADLGGQAASENVPAKNGIPKRTMSPDARERIAAAQWKRWAATKKNPPKQSAK